MNESNRRKFLKDGITATAGLGAALTLGACSPETSQAAEIDGNLAELRKSLTGDLLLPTDKGYEAASAPANGRYNDIRPLAVAECANEADVVICVNWSVKHDVPSVVRGGGHSYAGFSTTKGLLIDIGRLNTVTIDKENGTATVGGAATNRDLFKNSVGGDFILPGGTCLGVGVGGLVLGGGIGYNARWAGLTCDCLQSSKIVIASGKMLEVDASTNKDLYWACRGGAGGSFGINTSFVFKLVKVPEPKKGTYFRFEWQGADAAKAFLSAYHKLLTNPDPKLNSSAMVRAAPWGKVKEAIDVMVRGHYMGPIDDLRRLVQPLLQAAEPTMKVMEEKGFWDIQKIWVDWENKDQPPGETHSFGDISRYAEKPLSKQVTSDLVDKIVDAPILTEHAICSLWSLGWVGGKVMNRFKPAQTAYVHRNMLTLLRPTTVWPNHAPESVSDELQKWTDEMIAIIAPETPDQSYQNFPNRSLENYLQAYYGANLDRLKQVKKKYDPKNTFHNPQSIPPA